MTTPNTTIGLRLLSERKRLGLKQSDITSKLGIGRTTLHRYENNQSTPSIKAINGLTSLGFNMQYVLNDDAALENLITPQELELIKLFRQAQPIISTLNVWAFNERTQHYLLHLPVISPSSRMAAFLRCLLQVPPNTNQVCDEVETKKSHHSYTQPIQIHADLPNAAASAISSYVPTQPSFSNTAVSTESGQANLPSNPSPEHKNPKNSPSAQSLPTLKHQEHEAVEATQQPTPQLAPPISESFGC